MTKTSRGFLNTTVQTWDESTILFVTSRDSSSAWECAASDA